jgi:dimethylargininase
MLRALTRQVSSTFGACELTFLERQSIDIAKAMEQHRAYEACLKELGAQVISMPADESYPDGVFVEDPAIVLDEIAIITRPGAASRRGETESIAQALAPFRELRYIREPATLEGGDVIRVGKTLFVGLSGRTSREGIAQLAALLMVFDYSVVPVEVRGCLHLKSGACWAGGNVILANRNWIDASAFHDFKIIDVPEDEPAAADVLPVAGKLIMPSNFPHTAKILEDSGIEVFPIDVSELQKAESGVTCMSLLFHS